MQEVAAVCNRMLIINKGTLVADGTPEQLQKMEKGKQILMMEIEGTNVVPELKKLALIQADVEKITTKRLRIKIISSAKTPLQPLLSQLAQKHKWIIWKLYEEEQKLEDVFYKLTAE